MAVENSRDYIVQKIYLQKEYKGKFRKGIGVRLCRVIHHRYEADERRFLG